ncbi:MAG: hypothetical protein K6G32_07320, partial [Prevotella sp.]|nr:hypothetical protein [Prevotella sp.]
LHHVDTLEVNESQYNQYTFYSEDGTLQYQWLEGIGMKTGGIRIPYVTIKLPCLCDYEEFIACFDADGCQLYPQVEVIDDIATTMVSRASVLSPLFDLQGRRIQGEPVKKGVYLRGGKKYVRK